MRERGVSLRLTAETTFPNMAAAAAAFGVKQEIEDLFFVFCVCRKRNREEEMDVFTTRRPRRLSHAAGN